MRKYRIFTVDAFTDKMFSGNPAGVVAFCSGLSDIEMQNIAKEINLSETAFLFPTDDDSTFRIRYFTPTTEIDFCGHATIALSFVLGSIYNYTSRIDRLYLNTNIGIVPIDWLMEKGKLVSVIMTQVEPKVKKFSLDDYELGLIGLKPDDIDERYQIGLGYTGNWHLLVPVKSREVIDAANPDYIKLGTHNKNNNISTTHLYTFTNDEYLLYSRDFAPSVGLKEDPVTGSANGALVGYLILHKYLSEINDFKIKQTNTINRPGDLLIRTTFNEHLQIQVGGSAVIVLDGQISME